MLEQKINKYRDKFIDQHGCPKVFYLNNKYVLHNMPDTGNRIPKGNIGWINYWRAFSGITRDFIPCSSCGKSLSVHKELQPLHEAFSIFIPEMAKYEYAEGGHIEVKGIPGIDDGIYITPLCCEHNNQFDQDIVIQPNSILVEEVAPDFKKKTIDILGNT